MDDKLVDSIDKIAVEEVSPRSRDGRLESEEFENISLSDTLVEKKVDRSGFKSPKSTTKDEPEESDIDTAETEGDKNGFTEKFVKVSSLIDRTDVQNIDDKSKLTEKAGNIHVQETGQLQRENKTSSLEPLDLTDSMSLGDTVEENKSFVSAGTHWNDSTDSRLNTEEKRSEYRVVRTAEDLEKVTRKKTVVDESVEEDGVKENDQGLRNSTVFSIHDSAGDLEVTDVSLSPDTSVFDQEQEGRLTEHRKSDDAGEETEFKDRVLKSPGLAISLREHGELLALRRRSESAVCGCDKPPANYRKHSSGDLHSRLKTRKLLGVGETDDGDVHRSKLSQILGHSDQLYVRLPSGLRLWQIILAVVLTVLSLWALLFPGHYFSAMYDIDGSSFSFPIRLYACALICISMIYWSTLKVADREIIRLILLSSIVFFSLQSCVLVVGLITGDVPGTKWILTLVGIQVICVLIGYYFHSGMMNKTSRKDGLKRTGSYGKDLGEKEQ